MEFHTINSADKWLYEKYVKGDMRSSYNFVTGYIWSGKDTVKICEKGGCLIILWDNEKGFGMQYPQGKSENKAELIKECCQYLEGRGKRPEFYFLNEADVLELKSIMPDTFVFDYDRDNCDYIYDSSKLISLSGKKLHSKKNHLNSFRRNYNFRYRRMLQSDIPDCKALFNTWYDEKNGDENYLEESKTATFKLLDNIDNLGLIGGVIEVEGKIIACSVGERISDDTALIHIEFADRNYSGSYATINQQFVEHEWSDCLYINREEDMGDEGLRRAKESYQPIKLINVYSAKLK